MRVPGHKGTLGNELADTEATAAATATGDPPRCIFNASTWFLVRRTFTSQQPVNTLRVLVYGALEWSKYCNENCANGTLLGHRISPENAHVVVLVVVGLFD